MENWVVAGFTEVKECTSTITSYCFPAVITASMVDIWDILFPDPEAVKEILPGNKSASAWESNEPE